jgi:hypothetical protein
MSTTVSARPPTRDTIGTAPYLKAQSWVKPQGSKRDGTMRASAPAVEARRHDEGIRTGLNEMGEGFIIANKNRNLAHIRFRDRLIAILEIRISTAKQGKLHSFAHDGGNVLKKEIESFLPGQSTYDTEQKRIRG